MADIQQDNQDENEEDQGLTSSQPTGNIDASGGSSGQPGQPTRQTSKGSGMGQRLTTLRKYISRNAPQAQQMGQKIIGGITGRADALKSRLGGIQERVKAKQETELGRLQRGRDLLKPEGGLVSDAAKFTSEQGGQFSQFGETPEERLASFKKLREGQQTQTQMEEAPDVQKQLSKLQQETAATRTEGGRFGLLRSQFQRPDYSRGQQRLDQLLLQGRPGVAKEMMKTQEQSQAAAEQLSGLQGRIADRNLAIRESAQARRGEVAGLGLGERRGEIEAGSREAYQQAIQDKAATGTRYIEGLGQAIDAEEAAKLGMNEGQMLFGVDPRQYLSQQDPTLAGVTSQDEMARYQALGQLSDSVGGAYADPTQAGSYTGDIGVDPALQEAIAQQRGKFEGEYAKLTRRQEEADLQKQHIMDYSRGVLQEVMKNDPVKRRFFADLLNSGDLSRIAKRAEYESGNPTMLSSSEGLKTINDIIHQSGYQHGNYRASDKLSQLLAGEKSMGQEMEALKGRYGMAEGSDARTHVSDLEQQLHSGGKAGLTAAEQFDRRRKYTDIRNAMEKLRKYRLMQKQQELGNIG